MLSTVASKHFLRFFLPGIFLYMYRFPIMQRHPLRWFCSSVCPSRNNSRTKPGCRRYRSSLSGCRFGRSESSGFPGCFRRLRWSNCVPAPRVRSCRDRCRYRYICPSQTNPVSSSRSSERQKLPAFHTHPTLGLRVLCGLWLARPNLRLLLVLHKLMSNIKRLNI